MHAARYPPALAPSLVVFLSSAALAHTTRRHVAAPCRTRQPMGATSSPPVASAHVTRVEALYRKDGVRITHDPYSPGMAAKYGAPGATDADGFDPYADSVGAGIYSGTVQRRASDGSVVLGRQYQNHNPRPGPVYSGGGYTPVSRAIASFAREVERQGVSPGETTLGRILDAHPDLVNDVATGGATPLHTCGMSRDNQKAAAYLVSRGADVEALDTYGYSPLHRMASNNLAIGAEALLEAGADPNGRGEGGGTHPATEVARQSEAAAVLAVLGDATRAGRRKNPVVALRIFDDARPEISGEYVARDGAVDVPDGFAEVCAANGWDTKATWAKLNGGEDATWFKHRDEGNASYVYFNAGDGHWWIDGPDGLGVYKAPGPAWAPPGGSIRWKALDGAATSRPTLAVFRAK